MEMANPSMPTNCTLPQDTAAILKPVCLGKIPLSVKGPVWGMIVKVRHPVP